MPSRLALAATALLTLFAAGCGSSGYSSHGSSSTGAPATSGGYAATPAATTPAATTPAAAPASSSGALATKRASGATVLAAGPRHLTVYLFEADRGASSACSGACAAVWPPVPATHVVAGGARSALVGSIVRADGRRQLTYAGHPLYFYARDGDAGDAYGQGISSFGASWYVVTPAGAKVDRS